MSIKSKVFATAAALTLVGGVGAASTLSATAATPSCGHSCIDVFDRAFATHENPAFVQDVYRQGERVGQPIILFRQSNSDPAEDFTVSYQGQVSDFYAANLVSASLDLHYGGGCEVYKTPHRGSTTNPGHCLTYYPDDFAFEVEYSPYGVNSGLCVGVGTTATQGTPVALEPCGATAKTVWIQDVDNATGFVDSYTPFINGSDTNFSHPYVLDYPHNAFPTDSPRAQLITNELQLNSHNQIVQDTQEFSENFGTLR
ncbi:MAG: hypothetical protein M3Z75_26650 [Actinomycetota bacterium]|nr:hypothetical protein [Actinomycetota bacterium]